jgi:hypothetical protein
VAANLITNADVAGWLKLVEVDDAILTPVVAATNAWVAALPVLVGADPDADWPADVWQGAVMLAARWYRRRNTPAGVESYADNVVYLPRRDADVSALLHLARPAVG